MSGNLDAGYQVLKNFLSNGDSDFYALNKEYIDQTNYGHGIFSSNQGTEIVIEASREDINQEWEVFEYDPSLGDKIETFLKTGETDPYIVKLSEEIDFDDYIGGGKLEENTLGLVPREEIEELEQALIEKGYRVEEYIDKDKSIIINAETV